VREDQTDRHGFVCGPTKPHHDYTYIHTYTHTHTHTHTYIYNTYTRTDTHTNTHTDTQTHTHSYTQIHTQINIQVEPKGLFRAWYSIKKKGKRFPFPYRNEATFHAQNSWECVSVAKNKVLPKTQKKTHLHSREFGL
jgi:hypothetical protein